MYNEWIQRLEDMKCVSDDPDTQVVCIIELADKSDYFAGANMLPEGFENTPERVARPAKYNYISHAEDVAISYAAKYGYRVYGATAYLNWFPCSRCAAILVNSGIKKIVC